MVEKLDLWVRLQNRFFSQKNEMAPQCTGAIARGQKRRPNGSWGGQLKGPHGDCHTAQSTEPQLGSATQIIIVSRALGSNPLRHVFIILSFILTHLTLSYPLPWPPLPIFLTRPPSPIPPMPTQKKIRPRWPVWLPVGAARSYRAPEKLMPSKFCAPADTGECRPAHSNGWGCDPHWK